MNMVATDGSRLAHYHRNLDLKGQTNGRQPTEVIVPPQSLGHLVKLLNGESELVRCTLGASQVLFDLGDTQLVSRLIEGPYVNYRQVIPSQNSKQLQVANNHLLPAVRRVSILASSYTRQIRILLRGNSIELSASSQEVGGEARESIPAKYDQEEMEVGYNATYLMEILRKMGPQDVIFDLKNPVTAAILRPVDQTEGEDYFCLLMPLRPSG
jgi:DNA polymerase-3 subunit beta